MHSCSICFQSSNPVYPWQHCSLASILLFSDLHLPVYVCGLYKHSCSPSAWTICSWPRTHRATQCRAEWLFTHSSLEGEWLGRLLLWKPRLGVCATLIDLMLMTWGWHQAVKEWVTMMNGVRLGGGNVQKGSRCSYVKWVRWLITVACKCSLPLFTPTVNKCVWVGGQF